MSKKCPIEYTISLISGKWKIILIKELSKEPMRYGELLKEIPIISPKVLVQHLRELEKDKLIKREIFPEIPPRVEYSLSDKGRSMYNIFLELRKWGLAKDNEELAECNFCKKCQILL